PMERFLQEWSQQPVCRSDCSQRDGLVADLSGRHRSLHGWAAVARRLQGGFQWILLWGATWRRLDPMWAHLNRYRQFAFGWRPSAAVLGSGPDVVIGSGHEIGPSRRFSDSDYAPADPAAVASL